MANNVTHMTEFRVPGESNDAVDRADLQELTRRLSKYAPHDDRFDLAQGVHVFRASKIEPERTYMHSLPSICIVPQGAKSVAFADNGFEYDETKMVVYAAEIPINVRITKASKEEPYFCMIIPIDTQKLNDLIARVFPKGVPRADKTRAVYVGGIHPKILKSAIRFMELVEQQEDVDLLAPLVIEEILIRLLRSPAGPAIAQIGIADSHAGKIAKSISWLKENYVETVKMDDLAKVAGMSVSAFHKHFKEITSMSPLQFQKTLRLQEARHLLRAKSADVSEIAFEVGYASASQFSREYMRQFGVSPSRDAG